ncbi:MAG: AbrB/MazE/SpoVT family DNA-binding domain-containing protein [Crocosphaera sp.]|uniref:AbrB/MazE/SpoVT family DNA-binding domain-containing protein n=1 Tax=Crocosphaera sp. TaxID=2729996 RepID=UPI00257ED89B|nr:AbrB/MazE/SpoVT family DNA-binding domain-containing protein [Crocosphaera sp.]MCH2245811.1 AbrB/MazE/SpoVT family DNA-binding domain-containing protein [Crocosphaera sp.]NQZ60831.1 AbrB/MazE/SpoVT family DNA-binding domain-containing protein [Crocosphaera sp.]
MTDYRTTTKITDGGRIVIPAEYRRALALNTGDDVILTLEEGTIRILPRTEALRRAQEIVTRYTSYQELATELIEERRIEAENE